MASKKSERKVVRKTSARREVANRGPWHQRSVEGSRVDPVQRKALTNRIKKQVQANRKAGINVQPGHRIPGGGFLGNGAITQKAPHPKKKPPGKPNVKGSKGTKTGTIAKNPPCAARGTKAAEKGGTYSQGVGKPRTKAPSASSSKKKS